MVMFLNTPREGYANGLSGIIVESHHFSFEHIHRSEI